MSDQAVVVLGTRQQTNRDEVSICLERALKDADSGREFVSASKFRDSLFPFFEIGIAPRDAQELSALLAKPKVRQRLETLHVRYLVVASGGTQSGREKGGAVCGYGCIGAQHWDKQTDLKVLIWDLRDLEHQQYAEVSVEDTTAIAWIGLPIPVSIANTKKKACLRMRDEVLSFLRNEKVATPAARAETKN